MSDVSKLDDNNNDGTSACRVTSFINNTNCCDRTIKRSSTNSHLRSLRDTNQSIEQVSTDRRAEGFHWKHSSSSSSTLSESKVRNDEDNSSREEGNFSLEEETPLDESDETSSSSLSGKENRCNGARINGDRSKKITQLKKETPKSNLRGILKYPPGWRRRAISESCGPFRSTSSSSFDNNDLSYFGTSLESPDILFAFDDEEEEDTNDCDGSEKPKKYVTFSDKMATFVFRVNSSILGRRLKNQKRAKRKKEKKMRDSLENLASDDEQASSSSFDRAKDSDLNRISSSLDDDHLFDSSSDVSSSSGYDCSASDCSEVDDVEIPAEMLNRYDDETKISSGGGGGGDSSNCVDKAKRKNRRKRNRKNKQHVRTMLETGGGYESD